MQVGYQDEARDDGFLVLGVLQCGQLLDDHQVDGLPYRAQALTVVVEIRDRQFAHYFNLLSKMPHDASQTVQDVNTIPDGLLLEPLIHHLTNQIYIKRVLCENK